MSFRADVKLVCRGTPTASTHDLVDRNVLEVEVGGATGTEGMAGEEVELGRGEAEMEEVFGEEVGEGVDRHGAGAEDVGLQLAAREGEEEER